MQFSLNIVYTNVKIEELYIMHIAQPCKAEICCAYLHILNWCPSPLSVLQGEGPVVECPLENIAVEGNLPVPGEERVLGGGLQLHAGGVEVDALNNNPMKLIINIYYVKYLFSNILTSIVR